MDDSERSKRLQNVYSARDNRELASSYDEWAEDYDDDMLALGYAIPAVAAGFVGRHVPLGGPFYKAMHELEALQTRRQGGAAPLARLDVDGLPDQIAGE